MKLNKVVGANWKCMERIEYFLEERLLFSEQFARLKHVMMVQRKCLNSCVQRSTNTRRLMKTTASVNQCKTTTIIH